MNKKFFIFAGFCLFVLAISMLFFNNKILNYDFKKVELSNINPLNKANFQAYRIIRRNVVWQNIEDNINVDPSSIRRNKEYSEGWFRVYNSSTTDLGNINDKKIFYEKRRVRAYCEEKTMEFVHVKAYNSDNNIIGEFFKAPKGKAPYSDFTNGRVYFNVLCR